MIYNSIERQLIIENKTILSAFLIFNISVLKFKRSIHRKIEQILKQWN